VIACWPSTGVPHAGLTAIWQPGVCGELMGSYRLVFDPEQDRLLFDPEQDLEEVLLHSTA
jgi:hypothetical protein